MFYKDICNEIFAQHERAEDYKSSIGTKGLYEQIKQNRRFYLGDQWYGAKTGADKPLVRHNVIKRIGDYKTAVIAGENLNVLFSPIGVSDVNSKELQKNLAHDIIDGRQRHFEKLTDAEIVLASKAVSEYFRICANRIHLDDVIHNALKNAYISGTGIVYAYWDCNVKTGLFADDMRKMPIMGDICAEVINIENVDFSDPADDDVQNQEFIIIASRKPVGELIREAKKNGVSKAQINAIKPDNEYCDEDAFYTEKATVLTKFYKEYHDDGDFSIKAVKVCRDAIIKPEWDTRLKMYPIAKFNWEEENRAYGESEITNLIPNQIAINRMLTATVWSVMMMGMPIMVVNGDVITEPVTNNPGQIISFCGDPKDFDSAIKYITPPQFSGDLDDITSKLIENTLSSAGATDAALGTIKAQNTSAINAVKESARLPLTLIKNRYVTFIEEIAKIFLQFMLNMYGARPLAQKTADGETWYFPFEADRYRDLSFSCEAKVDNAPGEDIKQLAEELDRLSIEDKRELVNALVGENAKEEIK